MVVGCGTGDTRVDPSDLELRDLLGMSPEVASHWDADQRASARKLLVAGLHDAGDAVHIDIAGGASLDVRVAQTLAAVDAQRIRDGGVALGMVRVAIDAKTLTPALAPLAVTATAGGAVPAQEIWLAEQWDQQGLTHLAGRGLDLMSGLALDAGHTSGPIVVVPVAHLAVIAGYVPSTVAGTPARLVINPVMTAALEPNDVDATTTTGGGGGAPPAGGQTSAAIKTTTLVTTLVNDHAKTIEKAVGGNPYSFYGSYEECAAAERDRCDTCLANTSCKPVTNTADGNAECTMLGANNGKGYYELCINLALAISSVNNCTAGKVGSCARDATAADSLSTLTVNDDFLTDSSCSDGLDACLAQIYGAPNGNFPNPIGVDGGVIPPSQDPPRDVSPSCGKGCSNNTSASPNCDCKGGNCGNSLTCSSGCAASNSQSGCGGDASGCDSGDDGSSGSCDSSSSSSDSSGDCGGGSNTNDTGSCSSDNSGDSCSGGSSSGSSGSSCDNSSSSCGSSSSSSSGSSCSNGYSCGGSSGDSCGGSSSSSSGCGSSGGDSCGGSSGSSGCSGSSGSSGCSATKKEPSAVLAVVVSASWGIMPVPFAAFVRRRAREKKKKAKQAQQDGVQ